MLLLQSWNQRKQASSTTCHSSTPESLHCLGSFMGTMQERQFWGLLGEYLWGLLDKQGPSCWVFPCRGNQEEYEAIANATRLKSTVEDLAEVGSQGLNFALTISKKPQPTPVVTPPIEVSNSSLVLEKPVYAWHETDGVVLAGINRCFCILVWEETKKVVRNQFARH
ncbi:hypothetical protein CRYUN_Cryun17cG0020600 [Craigia yunnanensis]